MKAAILFTGSGPIVIVTNCESLTDPQVIRRLTAKGIAKFMGFELDVEKVRRRYGNHFDMVCEDFHETDDLRVVDYNSQRAFSLFSFSEFGEQFSHEISEEELGWGYVGSSAMSTPSSSTGAVKPVQ